MSRIKRIVNCIIVVCVLGSMVGCGKRQVDKNIVKPDIVSDTVKKYKKENMEFALKLLKNTYKEKENVVISPVSIQMSIAFALNGASGTTRAQLSKGVGIDVVAFNEYIKNYLGEMPNDVRCKILFANGMWINSNLGNVEISPEYNETMKEYTYADITKVPFNKDTKKGINDWCSEKTDGFINKILEATTKDDMIYTINAAGFNMDWKNSYNISDIKEDTFNNNGDSKVTIDMMSSVESIYLEDNNATGFIKPYYLPRFQYVVIMPDKDISMEKYIENMSVEKINKLLENAKEENVKATIPKYSESYKVDLKDALVNMGMDIMFNNKANFSGIMKNGSNIHMSQVVHKAKIEVGKSSTQLGGISNVSETKRKKIEYDKEVKLNRPYIYMIYDCEQNVPMFIGVQQKM